MGPLRPNRPSDHVAPYMARGESVVLEMKQHWARLLPALSSCLIGLVLVLVAGFSAPAWMGQVTNAAWWIWLILLAHLAWRVIEWMDETFVITNKRLILVHGLFVKKVAMMPLSKVTDMSYNRSPAARILGYGTFKIESAGQEQALNVIDFVRNPNDMYRDICALIFGLDDEDDAPAHPVHDVHEDADSPRLVRRDGAWHESDEDGYENEGYENEGYEDVPHDEAPWDDEPRRSHSSGGGPRSGSRSAQPQERWATTHPNHDPDATDPYGIITFDDAISQSDLPHTYDGVRRGHASHDSQTDTDDESAWSVSREHATRPQNVRSSRKSDTPPTWRDSE